MCGIAGYIDHSFASDKVLRRMTTTLQHRGPDAAGYFQNNIVGLGSRRLAIIDLSGGNQPMSIGDYIMVYNGEIYNFKSLRSTLEHKKIIFKTSSDTEVLLRLFMEDGMQSLQQLNGMFALAIYNQRTNEFWLIRDRLGIKPLYYSIIGKTLVFGSEIKAILAFPTFKRELNTSALDSYFKYRYCVGDETFFKRIQSVPAGHLLYRNKNAQVSINRYWQLKLENHKDDLGEEAYHNRVEELLLAAVKRRMISDVPIGAYLSGGLDSSLITAMMARQQNTTLTTFSVGFKEKGFSELRFARQIAKQYETDHHELLVDQNDYWDSMAELIQIKDAPLGVPNEVPLYLMSRALKKYFTVVLSGEGADELFGGYGRIMASYIDFQRGNTNSFLDFFLKQYNYTTQETLEKFLAQPILAAIGKDAYTEHFWDSKYQQANTLAIQDRIPFMFQTVHLQGLLQRVDATTMGASVEGRVPFVDHELVEYVNAIPFQYKIAWNSPKSSGLIETKKLSSAEFSETHDVPKFLLKKIAETYLPQQIIYRKKMGFPVPLDVWTGSDFGKKSISLLREKKTLNRGIYDKVYVKSAKFSEEMRGMTLWMMVNAELFFREYFD